MTFIDLAKQVADGSDPTEVLDEMAHQVTLYHGTSLANAKKIMKTGLKPFKGGGNLSTGGGHEAAVYLTGDLGTAARYATGDGFPVVLEVSITKAKRVSSLKLDPMDDPEAGWNPDGVDSYSDQEFEYLFTEIRDWLREKKWSNGYDYNEGNFTSPERELRGYNVYKKMSAWFKKHRRATAASDFAAFLKKFPPGEYGSLHLNRDGSVWLDASHFQNLHQLQYPKPLPPVAIKRAWVPANVAETGKVHVVSKSAEKVTVKRLGGEAPALLDAIKSDGNDYKQRMEDALEEGDPDDIKNVGAEIVGEIEGGIARYNKEDPGKFGDVYADWMKDFLSIAKKMARGEIDGLDKEIEDAFESLDMGFNDEWHNDDFASYEVAMVEIKPSDLVKL
jgi:hypothetical protein